jgi:hypothetical protein
LESHWCHIKVGERTLARGVDFDHVVLAIGLGAFKKLNNEPSMCQQLIDANDAFRQMTEHIGITPTFGVQLWMTRDLRELGCKLVRPAFDGAREPLDVWADMSQLLDRESWSHVRPPRPRSIQYLCGPLNTRLHLRPASDLRVPALALKEVTDLAEIWLRHAPAVIWPKAVRPGTEALDWRELYSPVPCHKPSDRLAQQWLRPNVDPTECCAASWHGSTQYRLRPDESGFINLSLAGAWTRNGFNATSIEAAVMSGMAAARAICGEPTDIVGYPFLQG